MSFNLTADTSLCEAQFFWQMEQKFWVNGRLPHFLLLMEGIKLSKWKLELSSSQPQLVSLSLVLKCSETLNLDYHFIFSK